MLQQNDIQSMASEGSTNQHQLDNHFNQAFPSNGPLKLVTGYE